MSSSQLHEDQEGSAPIPTIQVTDYSSDTPGGTEETASPGPSSGSSLALLSPTSHGDVSNMPSRSTRSQSTRRKPSVSRSNVKTDDWASVMQPEERRRIQNRIAQRKFRDKAREQREQAQRESQNNEHAASAYHVPEADEIAPEEEELSGLPWGGIGMRYVVAKGHETASQQSSRQTSDHRFETSHPLLNPYGGGYGVALSHGEPSHEGTALETPSLEGLDSNIDEYRFYGASPFFYDYEPGGQNQGPQM